MPILVCPRCQRANPEVASFCYYDGAELKAGAGAQVNRLAREFIFPTGRRCQTFDELAQGCQEEWATARDLLKQGVFGQYFSTVGRLDLAKATQEAMAQADPDIALTTFLGALPVSRGQAPHLDINPRRILLGNLHLGDNRQIPLVVTNQGQGILQGSIKVTEGGEWFRIAGSADGQAAIKTPREQQLMLQAETKSLQAAQAYGAKLTVVTNGGVVEVPVRMDLVPHPYPRGPFQGAKTPRDLAVRMREQPKAAVPLLESGEITRWFQSNGWSYPVRGTPVKGVAGVQQFFEAMGLSKPPPVQISQQEFRFALQYPEHTRGQLNLHTSVKKWVYANVESDSSWLKVLTPLPAGPQQAAIGFEVDSRLVPDRRVEGRLKISANGGQNLTVRVSVEVRGAPAVALGRRRGFLGPIFAVALAFLYLRLLLVPFVDLMGRGPAARTGAAHVPIKLEADSPLGRVGGWLALPWNRIVTGANLSDKAFNPGGTEAEYNGMEFRHYCLSAFIRRFVLWTFWIGAVIGALILIRRGSMLDLPWGLIAGAVAGAGLSATLACTLLLGEMIPLGLWGLLGLGGNIGLLFVWILLALGYWFGLGAVAGLLIGRWVKVPADTLAGRVCRMCGLRGLVA